MGNKCEIDGCNDQRHDYLPMCFRHWRRVPHMFRREVHWRHGRWMIAEAQGSYAEYVAERGAFKEQCEAAVRVVNAKLAAEASRA